ncbi:prepilin-type N-terminal cleavage/methylation domain-containing protein [Candidatus Microgenomates bacterium]|nr:prepilin-type N-terminal cleavage/methylation domain-containing protein [Candidatus Microgenomates bacterium]
MKVQPARKGQSLIEVLIALGIGVLVIVALVQSLVTSIKNSQFAKNQNLATRYSQDAVENIRSERDKLGWTAMFTTYNNKTYCIGTGDSSTWTLKQPSCAVNVGVIFTREADFSDPDGASEKLLVEVTTSWTDSSGTHSSKQNTFLTKWE